MGFCGECGKPITDADQFCASCGTSLSIFRTEATSSTTPRQVFTPKTSSSSPASFSSSPTFVCGGCNSRSSESERVLAFGKEWHPRCFKCTHCNKPLQQFCEKNGSPYCENDYKKLFSTLCKSCRKPIDGASMHDNKGGIYHPSCFTCSKCGTQMDTTFYWNNQNPTCVSCATTASPSGMSSSTKNSNSNRNTSNSSTSSGTESASNKRMTREITLTKGENCGRCHRDLNTGSSIVITEGQNFHKQCFTCEICSNPIIGMYYVGSPGKNICTNCYDGGKLSYCGSCGKTIIGERVSMSGSSYHGACLRCNKCNKKIEVKGSVGSVAFSEGKFYCSACAKS